MPDRPNLRRLEGKGTAVDADDGRREPLGCAELPRRVPVRVPEHERNAARTDERRREQYVERDHVSNDGFGREDACQLTLESNSASRPSG